MCIKQKSDFFKKKNYIRNDTDPDPKHWGKTHKKNIFSFAFPLPPFPLFFSLIFHNKRGQEWTAQKFISI